MGEKGRGGRRKVRGRAGLSDGQSEGDDNAVHGLVLPSHGAAPCGGRRWVALNTGKSQGFRALGVRPNTQHSSLQPPEVSPPSSIQRFKRQL